MYHTQEKRGKFLNFSIPCKKDNAWLGIAHYFWYDTKDATIWGQKSKRNYGYYDVYVADIDCEDVIDTVFNEEQYLWWVKQIKKAELTFLKKGQIPTLKLLNDYFLQHNIWDNIGGVLFQDISPNSEHWFGNEVQYIKRIQLAVYNPQIISNFAHDYDGKCV